MGWHCGDTTGGWVTPWGHEVLGDTMRVTPQGGSVLGWHYGDKGRKGRRGDGWRRGGTEKTTGGGVAGWGRGVVVTPWGQPAKG